MENKGKIKLKFSACGIKFSAGGAEKPVKLLLYESHPVKLGIEGQHCKVRTYDLAPTRGYLQSQTLHLVNTTFFFYFCILFGLGLLFIYCSFLFRFTTDAEYIK